MSRHEADDPPRSWVERHFALLLGLVSDTGTVVPRASTRIDWFSPTDY